MKAPDPPYMTLGGSAWVYSAISAAKACRLMPPDILSARARKLLLSRATTLLGGEG